MATIVWKGGASTVAQVQTDEFTGGTWNGGASLQEWKYLYQLSGRHRYTRRRQRPEGTGHIRQRHIHLRCR